MEVVPTILLPKQDNLHVMRYSSILCGILPLSSRHRSHRNISFGIWAQTVSLRRVLFPIGGNVITSLATRLMPGSRNVTCPNGDRQGWHHHAGGRLPIFQRAADDRGRAAGVKLRFQHVRRSRRRRVRRETGLR